MNKTTLEQYLRDGCEQFVIDHALRARVNEDGDVVFYIHPNGGNGDTLDFRVEGNGLKPLR